MFDIPNAADAHKTAWTILEIAHKNVCMRTDAPLTSRELLIEIAIEVLEQNFPKHEHLDAAIDSLTEYAVEQDFLTR